jgi:hypothetical protein
VERTHRKVSEMIVGTAKPIEEIAAFISGFHKVLILG